MTHRKNSAHLAKRALAQNLQKLKLGRVGFLRALLHMVRDVDFLHNAFTLKKRGHS